ncbi:MAG: AAA family ATPase [Planctomycetota bacterium]|nr:AAA family ATPase [Planctomycetota bacterium]
MLQMLSTADGLDIALGAPIGAGAVGRVVHGTLRTAWREWPAGTEVAIKRLHPHLRLDPSARRSLQSEARVGRLVRHPSLVRHVSDGEDLDGPYLVTEFVAGRSLRELILSSAPVPEPVVRGIAHSIYGALAALHAAGFVHADVKPENIRIEPSGRAVLLDLGFALSPAEQASAHARSWKSVSAVAPEGSAMPAPELALAEAVNPGSLAYLSPERARGLPAEPASDVFSLGLVLYETATGRHPFLADDDEGGISAATGFSSGKLLRRGVVDEGADRLLAEIATARHVPPSRLVPQLSPFFDAALLEALRRDPRLRATAAEFDQRFAEGEKGNWWRSQLDFGPTARRGTLGETDSLHLTPLVGRERERDLLLEQCIAAATHGTAVWITGESGMGKSRLVSDVASAARRRLEPPPLYLYARCSPFEEQRPCTPILRLLERYLRLPPGAEIGPREREQLARVLPTAVATTLAQALTPSFHGSTEIAVPAALAHWLQAVGRAEPLVVFLDDANFADEGSIAVLRHVADVLRTTRMLLVLGVRTHDTEPPPELARLKQSLADHGALQELALEALDEPAIAELTNALFHHSQPRRRIAQVLFDRSRGNPGLVAETIRSLVERGDARPYGPVDRKLVLEIAPERLPLPESVHTLIAERLAKASEEDRKWLERLSVVGGRIESAFLARTFHDSGPGEIDSALLRLAHSGWLVSTGDRYRFARPALREAVYRALGPARRRELHSLAADALLAPETEGEDTSARKLPIGDAFQRAFHLRAAERHLDLLRLLRPLLHALLRRGQPQRVYVLSRWGIDALAKVTTSRARDRWRIEFLEAAADAADRLGYRTEQRNWLDQLSDLQFDAERDPDALARVYILHGRYAASTGQYGLARGMLRNAVKLADAASSDEIASEALRRLGAVQAHVGELEEARELLEQAHERAVHEPQRALALIQLSIVELLDNRVEEALRHVDIALRLQRRARKWNLPGITAAAHMLRGRIYRVCGRPARALGSMKRAVTLARQSGERRLEMEATARLGGLLLDMNEPEEAETRLREALLIASEIEDRRGQTLALVWLGTLLWEQADPEAAGTLDRAQRMANEMGLQRAESLALAIRSRIEREKGQLERALELSGLADEILARQGAELPDRIVVVGTRVLVLRSAGHDDEANELLEALESRMKRENDRIKDVELRKVHRSATTRLLGAVLSPEGVIYPRVGLEAPAPSEAETEGE